MAGKVYLVGAGPGDPGLLTRRGEEVLRRADVVLYDALISKELLDLAPPECERIFVGKRAGESALEQSRINEELIGRAHMDKRVVRLKGGDPYVYGRGGEEALACKAAGVDVEVVPGVSSAIAVPACAGIPILQRGLAGTVLFLHGRLRKRNPVLTPLPDEASGEPLDFEVGERQTSKISLAPFRGQTEVSKKGGVVIRRHEHGAKVLSDALPIGRFGESEAEQRALEDAVNLADDLETGTAAESSIAVDWKSACRAADTLVILMGMGSLEVIRDGLIEGGRPPSHPVAVVQWGTTPRQRSIISNVADFPEACREAGMTTPGVIVVGEVVNLSPQLNQFEERPLFGWRVAVTRPEESDDEISIHLSDMGARVISTPATKSTALTGLSMELEALQDDLRTATHLVFSSHNGVTAFFGALRQARLDIRVIPAHTEIMAAGEATYRVLSDHGLEATRVNTPFTWKEFHEAFGKRLENAHVIITESVHSRGDITEQLLSRGARVTELPLYEFVPHRIGIETLRTSLENGDLDVVTFFSPSAVDALLTVWGKRRMQELLEKAVIATNSQAAGASLKKLDVMVHVQAQDRSTWSLTRELARYRGIHFK